MALTERQRAALDAGRGRKKGSQNKLTLAVKQVFEQVAVQLGGVDRMVAWAKEDAANERIFWGTIYPKLLPFQGQQYTRLTTARGVL